MTLYFAYGSNLNIEQMKRRCPKAKPLGRFELPDSTLVFRGVADCINSPGDTCSGAVWQITDECELALDRYEGFDPKYPNSGMYRKVYVQLAEPYEGETELMLYVMNSTGIFPPSEGYLATIREGYRNFGIPFKSLDAAVKASWDDKAPTHIERQRHRRKGRPMLAPRNRLSKRRKSQAPTQPQTERPSSEPDKPAGSTSAWNRAMTVYGD